jgi:molybdopterin molybdotransferase
VTQFTHFIMVDWSGGNDTGPRPRKDAIWIGESGQEPVYLRNRQAARDWLQTRIKAGLARDERLMIGFDFPFGYPQGFARAMTGSDDPLELWDWLAGRISDAVDQNNRFDLAGQINQRFEGIGPFWGNGLKRDIPGLPRHKRDGYDNPFPDRRACEIRAKGSFTCWQLGGAGAVGSQVLMGLPVLAQLRAEFPDQIAVWPFQPLEAPVAFVEIWPSLINDQIRSETGPEDIRDAVQVRLLADRLAALPADALAQMLDVTAPEEGWILGLGHEDLLRHSPLKPPPLRNDCFALPPGVDWTPVEDAMALLRDRLHPVTAPETLPLQQASGRVLAQDLIAKRSNPPLPNTAVDGYGFAANCLRAGDMELPLMDGRAAAGVPFDGIVPEGHAIRVLTGAALPDGVDTVVLEEDCSSDGTRIAFRGDLKPGANTRRAGEDALAGDLILPAGRILTPADLALASATGLSDLPVRERLKVAVLSTGDELVEPGQPAAKGQIFDANRPMLLNLIARLGYEPLDLGRVPDDRNALAATLNQAANQAHVILTSGGASAGDEDHVSALLRESGALQEWRIALKPGRPLALGMWQGTPVFGLPGNPVAAFVCTLIFARPAMGLLSGAGWQDPQGFDLPAAFSKNKKPGRREYLRARMRDGQAEVFKSEGSGRVSSLSWAEGLVELPDGPAQIKPGDKVRYIPLGSFGL